MSPDRRALLQAGTLLAAGVGVNLRAQTFLPPQDIRPLIEKVTQGAAIRRGRIVIEVPAIAENGNSVPLSLRVESPMSQEQHVVSLHVLAPRNPRPLVAVFHFTPAQGRATVSTRIRLAVTQRIIVLATMSDKSYWSDETSIAVTAAACLDEAL